MLLCEKEIPTKQGLEAQEISLKKGGCCCRGRMERKVPGKEAKVSLRAVDGGDGSSLAEDDSTVAVGSSDGEGNSNL